MSEASTPKYNAIPALEVRQIHKTFRDRRREVPVLQDISLRVPAGEFVSIIGPSGCGKSTLFHVIGGLTVPDQGEVLLQGRPVTGQLIHDTGYPEYFQSLVVRAEDVTEQAECLSALIPIMQQAEVDYVTDPAATNALVVELVETYDTGWVYSADLADWSLATQLEYGLVSNGDDDTLGNYDLDRVQQLIDLIDEYTEFDVSGYAPEDLVTNEFIDPSIGLP